MIRESADWVLLGTFRRRVCEGQRGSKFREPVWITEEIQIEIKRRREFNRRKRRGREENKEENWRRYRQQKEWVKTLIRREKEEHERKLTREIREAKDSEQKMWKMIIKLKGIYRDERDTPLYDDNGAVVEVDEMQKVMMNFWTPNYRSEDNEMMTEWGNGKRREHRVVSGKR